LISTDLWASYAYAPLLILFDKEPPMPDEQGLAEGGPCPEATDTALLIPCVRVQTWSAHLYQNDADVK